MSALAAALCVLFAAVSIKLVDTQVLNPDQFVAQGRAQRLVSAVLPAGRGAILDRNGRELALSIPQRSIFADPGLVVDVEAEASQLSPILDIEADVLVEKLSLDSRYVVLRHTVPDAVADRVAALGLRSIGSFEEFKRHRPNAELARALLGGVGTDGAKGASGLELQLDRILRGRPGNITYERGLGGGTIANGRQTVEPARPGADVALTIDRALQYETEQTLAAYLVKAGAKGGIAIISRPSTGEILALANMSVDQGTGEPSSTSNNLALTTVYEPGSVNKLITVAGILEEGLVAPDTRLEVPAALQVADHEFTDHDPHPPASWSVTDILATSSNVGTIKLAQELGEDRVDSYLRRFGFGTKTGLGFPDESAGLLLDRDEWSGTSIGSIPLGQGVSVTAMQMLMAYNVIANDGTYVPPRLVREVVRRDGREGLPSGDRRRVVSAETASQVRAMLAQVVSRGTGQAAAVPGYSVAGKTGTARKPQPEGGYEDAEGRMQYVATFAGMVPAERPDLSVIVVLDEPSKSIFAGDVAAPAFSALARRALRRFAIPPSAGGDTAQGVPDISDSARDVTDAPVPGAAPPGTPPPGTQPTTGGTSSEGGSAARRENGSAGDATTDPSSPP